jgi:hypothetical protein
MVRLFLAGAKRKMIRFPHRHHEPIKRGLITLAFRDWKTLNLQKDRVYKSGNLGLLRIVDVGFRKLDEIGFEEIKKCGCRNIHEFREEYEEVADRKIDFHNECSVRVEFEYIGKEIQDRKKLLGKVSLLELYELKFKILALDGETPRRGLVDTMKALAGSDSSTLEGLGEVLHIPISTVISNTQTLRRLNLVRSKGGKGVIATPLSLKLLKILDLED